MKKAVIVLSIVVVLLIAAVGVMGKFVWDLNKKVEENRQLNARTHTYTKSVDASAQKRDKTIEQHYNAEIEVLIGQIASLDEQVIANTEDIRVTRIGLGEMAIFVVLLNNVRAVKLQRVEKELRAEIAKVDRKALASIKLVRDHTGKKVWIFWNHDNKVKEDAEKILLIDEFLKKLEEIKSQENN